MYPSWYICKEALLIDLTNLKVVFIDSFGQETLLSSAEVSKDSFSMGFLYPQFNIPSTGLLSILTTILYPNVSYNRHFALFTLDTGMVVISTFFE